METTVTIAEQSASSEDDGRSHLNYRSQPREHLRTLRLPIYHPDDENYLTELVCLVRRQLEVFIVLASKGDGDRNNGAKGEAEGGNTSGVSDSLRAPRWARADGFDAEDAADVKVGIRCVHCAPPDGVDDADVPCGAKRGRRRKNSTLRKASFGEHDWVKKGAKDVPRRAKGAVTHPTSTRLVYQGIRNWQRYHLMACPDIPFDVKQKFQSLKSAKSQRRNCTESTKYWEVGCARLGLIDTEHGLSVRKSVLDREWTGENGQEAARKVADELGLMLISTPAGKSAGPGVKKKGLSVPYHEPEIQTSTVDIPLGNNTTRVADGKIDVLNQKRTPHNDCIKTEEISSSHKDVTLGALTGHETSSLPVIYDADGRSSQHRLSSSEGMQSHIRGLNELRGPALLQSESLLHSQPENELVPGEEIAGEAVYAKLKRFQTSSTSPAVVDTPTERYEANLKDGGKIVPLAASESCPSPAPFSSCLALPLIPSDGLSKTDVSIRSEGASSAQSVENHANPSVRLSVSQWSRDEIIYRVGLARSIVHTIKDIRQLPSSSGERQHHDLSHLGMELYELFTGRNPYDIDEIEKDCDHREDEFVSSLDDFEKMSEQRRKKEKPNSRGYTRLRELGLPNSLCSMVSSLLDNDNSYASLDEVEKDLLLMERQPEKLLFAIPNGDFHTPKYSLYGRMTETSKLLEVFEQTIDVRHRTNNMVIISGYSGTGKSSLVRSIESRLIDKGAKFVTGKFDAMQQIQPLSAVVSALDDYCDLLAQDSDRVDQVREAVTSVLGRDGLVLAKQLPNLRKLVSFREGPKSVQVSGREALQRLMFLFRLLLQVTCSRDHPVVLFLDDLQWADEISLELIHALVTDQQICGFLFVGCYRSNEVCSSHSLIRRLDKIQRTESNVRVTTISVDNLDKNAVNDMLSDAFQTLPRRTQHLSEVVLQKTAGNALFVEQFLSSLHHEGLFRFSLLAREWEWDINGIRQKDIADNVLEFMIAKILRLAPEVREALQVAACFGAQCHEDVLQILDRAPESASSTAVALDVGVSEGLLVKTKSTYTFSHDQIQRAAYLLIPDPVYFHLRIGRLLLKWSSTEETDCNLFVMVDQLHRGACLLKDRNEKIKLAHLCLMAGMKASIKSAFLPSSAYYQAGIGLLSSGEWDSHRELCLELYNSSLETEYILGDFDAMMTHIDEVLNRGGTIEEKIRAYRTLVQSLAAQGHVPRAIETALAVLGQLGESIPMSVTPAQVKLELEATQQMLQLQTIDALSQLEVMRDSRTMEAMRFLYVITTYLYYVRKEYLPIVICRMIQLSLSHGVCRESAFAFACYGITLIGVSGNVEESYRIGNLALGLIDRFEARESFARTHCTVYGFLNPWIDPVQSCLPPLKHAIDVGLLTGDTEYAMISVQQYTLLSLVSGQELGRLLDEMRTYARQMLDFKHMTIHCLSAPLRQFALNLLGRSANPTRLVGEEMDEDTVLENIESGRAYMDTQICFLRMWLQYIFGEYELAAETASRNGNVEDQHVAKFGLVCNHVFFSGLAALAMARKEERHKWNNIINETIERMKIWTTSCQWNCQHKFELMSAECAYLDGDIHAATEMYGSAVATAAKHRFVHEEALALERAGIFHLENGNDVTAAELFQRAHSCYLKWGACSKAMHIQQTYL